MLHFLSIFSICFIENLLKTEEKYTYLVYIDKNELLQSMRKRLISHEGISIFDRK